MKTFVALFFTLLSASGAADTIVAPPGISGLPDRLECGRYEISGKLGGSATDASFVQVYPGTTRRFDLPLRQLDEEDELSYAERDVRLTVYITTPGRGAEARARVIGRATLVTLSEALGKPIKLVEKIECRAIPAP